MSRVALARSLAAPRPPHLARRPAAFAALRPARGPSRRRVFPGVHEAHDWGGDLVHASRVAGDAIIVYVGVLCTLNWAMYKRIREDAERGRDGGGDGKGRRGGDGDGQGRGERKAGDRTGDRGGDHD